MFIVICGGGKIGLHLVRSLLTSGHEVALVERDRRVCESVYRDFEEVRVIAGDATNAELLIRAGIEQADVLVAVAGRDQDNYKICKMGKEFFHVKRTLARVNDPRNDELFRLAGVDTVISVTSMVSNAIEYEIVPHDVVKLFTWHASMTAIELTLPAHAPVVGLALRKLDLPPNSLIAALWRGGEALVPDGNTVLSAGDQVFAVTLKDHEPQLRAMLAGA
ncbi:MAG: TrkA family potassium uptake protein [Candidatus Sericytochromatia bacterium]|nr:TrkA family potassium uptake protein [Candidatus Sericytochromatia bacterium]